MKIIKKEVSKTMEETEQQEQPSMEESKPQEAMFQQLHLLKDEAVFRYNLLIELRKITLSLESIQANLETLLEEESEASE